jgi:hypothetical protein
MVISMCTRRLVDMHLSIQQWEIEFQNDMYLSSHLSSFIHYLYLTLPLTVTDVIVREVIVIRLMYYTHPSDGKLHV